MNNVFYMKKLTKNAFIQKAKEIHGGIYDYSKVEYINQQTKVCIICKKHGEFWQTPANHTNKRLHQGCPECKKEKLSKLRILNKNDVIMLSKKIHGNKYDYSESIYNGKHIKMKIKCNTCGSYFWQEPNSHLSGRGCPYCANKFLDTDKIVKMFKETHGDKYDYSKVEYKTMNTKTCIICPKHGEFWQTPYKHLKAKQGCPSCKESHLEGEIRNLLNENKIQFEYDKTQKWLGKQRLDFFLPKYNIAIECQGIQHFKPSSFSSKIDAEENFKKLRKLDELKLKKCKKNGINVLYYTDLGYKTFLKEKIYTDKNELIKTIFTA